MKVTNNIRLCQKNLHSEVCVRRAAVLANVRWQLGGQEKDTGRALSRVGKNFVAASAGFTMMASSCTNRSSVKQARNSAACITQPTGFEYVFGSTTLNTNLATEPDVCAERTMLMWPRIAALSWHLDAKQPHSFSKRHVTTGDAAAF